MKPFIFEDKSPHTLGIGIQNILDLNGRFINCKEVRTYKHLIGEFGLDCKDSAYKEIRIVIVGSGIGGLVFCLIMAKRLGLCLKKHHWWAITNRLSDKTFLIWCTYIGGFRGQT